MTNLRRLRIEQVVDKVVGLITVSSGWTGAVKWCKSGRTILTTSKNRQKK
ncbi:hypothetical protein [Psychrobacter phage vB_PmaS_Y8A]|nr:hypothetical protein [Psychrobacter phage vB_PmaS_Y8A]